MARPRGEDGMTKEEKITCITILGVLFLFIFFVEYLFFHPKIRNISYCNDDRYYMVNAVTGDGRTSDSWHFGAIKKRIMICGRMEQQLQFGLLVQGMKIEAGD